MTPLTAQERLFVVLAIVLLIVGATAESWATVELEEGATFFDDFTCVEADGTLGISTADGQCLTPADYDKIFSFENLSQIEIVTSPDTEIAGQSIAEVYGITADDDPASERPLGEGVTAEPFTFVDTVRYVHGLPIRLA